MQWKKIETAPRDGTIVLGYDPGWYDIVTPILFDTKRDAFVFFHIPGEVVRATHWMSMPPHPDATSLEIELQARVEQLEKGLSDLIDIASACDSWEQFPSDALEAANAVLNG